MGYTDKEKQAEYQRRWHQKHKESRREKLDQRKQVYKKKVDALKASTPCKDCGMQFPSWVMQFDHVRGEKVDNISQLISNKQFKLCDEEIKKCEIVCANCHADRTYRRLGL
jgi:hypothetical protein